MKILNVIMILLVLSACQSVEKEERFYCGDEVIEGRAFFKKMKNITHFKNIKSNKISEKNINIGVKGKADYHKNVLFEIDIINGYAELDEVFFKNDSLLLCDDRGNCSSLFSFNENFLSDNISFGLQGRFGKKIVDRKCNDTIYVFEYSYFIEDKGLMEEELKEIWASRERGILKVVYQDEIRDLWVGKYYPELDE